MNNETMQVRSAEHNQDLSHIHDRNQMPTLRDVMAVLFRQRWAMLIAFGLVVIGVAASGVWIPKYEAHMKILVRRPRPDTTATPWAPVSNQFVDTSVSEEDLNSEIELLNSADLLRNVVITTGLSGNLQSATPKASEVKIAKAEQKLAGNLKVEALHKSNVISVSYSNRNPQTAAQVLNTLAAAYTDKHLEMVRSTNELKFFDQQAEEYRKGLDEAQQKLSEFTKQSGIVSATTERDSTLQRANEFDFAAHQAQAQVEETQQRIRTLQGQLQAAKPRMTTAVRTSVNPALMEQLKSTLLNLQLKQTELLTKYEPSHPLVQEVEKQITSTQDAITAEENKPLREETTDQDPNYQWIQTELTKEQSDLSGLTARAAASAAMAEKYHSEARQLDQSGVVQQDLQRAAKTQEDNYLLYEHKREEARIGAALDQHGILDVTISEQPVVPALPARSILVVGLLILGVGFVGCIFAAFVFDSIDPTFRTPDELSSFVGAPVLASLPYQGGAMAALPPSGE